MIKNLNELAKIREAYEGKINFRQPSKDATVSDGNVKKHVLICGGTGCTSSKSVQIKAEMEKAIKEAGIENEVQVVLTGCFGLCALGPIVIVYPEGTFYSRIEIKDAETIVKEHLVGGNPVKSLLYSETVKGDEILSLNETAFYKKQKRVALRNCGLIDPECINEYIGTNGYTALGKVITEMTPDEVIKEILDSGIRGRGGGGFPTGRKWAFAAAQPKGQKYVVCNADEGDPHALIEAMAIAGYAIGANQGYVYVRAEYPIAVNRLQKAIDDARAEGLLGKNIFGTEFEFDLQIRLGAGAFVCGEETALLTSIEGNRGEPRPRPPFPAVKGLWGKPTIINNVETYANIPQIINKGAKWFTSMGTEKSKGTKVFALGGKIVNTGLVEIPMGTTLREVVEEIGGGIPNGKKFKAAQTGGPSGGCIPASKYDVEIDYDNLIAQGSMMGSGGLIVMDEDTCMVDLAKFFLEFTVDESCGKCAPCRIGTVRLLEILNKITEGNGEMEDLDKLEELANYIKSASLCGLGQTAPNPVLSTLANFRDEYIAHIVDKKCPAGVCKNLMSYKIDQEKCIGCGMCMRQCPADAIYKTDYIAPGHKLPSLAIDASKCVKCGACLSGCRKINAIYKD